MKNLNRIGIGIDSHRLEAGRPCRLAGVDIPSEVGPVGHSDGDVVLHAACDAVLGAAGHDDLGTLFPDSDPKLAGADSAGFCDAAVRAVSKLGFVIASLDIVIETEQPKIAPHRTAMKQRLAQLFRIYPDRVNVRGKTAEGLDSIGRGEAIRATAIALLAPAPRVGD